MAHSASSNSSAPGLAAPSHCSAHSPSCQRSSSKTRGRRSALLLRQCLAMLALTALLLTRSAHAAQATEDEALEHMRRLMEDMAAGRSASSSQAAGSSHGGAAAGAAGAASADAADADAGAARTLHSLLGSSTSTTRTPVFEIPAGLRSLLRTSVAPANIASIFSKWEARRSASPSSSSSSSGSGSSGSSDKFSLNLTAIASGAGYRGVTSNKANPAAAALQEAIDSATAGIVSNALNTASGILYTVSGGLATLGGAFGIFTADFARQSSRALFGVSEYSFAQTLYNDFNAQIDGSDYLGDAAKYIKLWNKLKAEISTGQLTADIQSQMDQMATAQAILKAVVSTAGSA